jgi:hypothetical protein
MTMGRAYWLTTCLWVGAVLASAPLVIEQFDQRGVALLVPGLSVSASELVFAAAAALTPPLVVRAILRRRRASAWPASRVRR